MHISLLHRMWEDLVLRTYFHTICGSKSRAIFRGLRIRKITNSFFMVVNKRVFTEFSELPRFELLSGRCRFPNISKSPRERPLARPQMAKARWRQRLGRQLSRNRWATRPPISARRLAFAILVEGGRPEQVRQILRWCGVPVPAGRALYSAMREVEEFSMVYFNISTQNRFFLWRPPSIEIRIESLSKFWAFLRLPQLIVGMLHWWFCSQFVWRISRASLDRILN